MLEWLLNLPAWFWLIYMPGALVSYGLCKGSMYKGVPSRPGIKWVLFFEGVSWFVCIFSLIGIFATYVSIKVHGGSFAFRFLIPEGGIK